MAETKHVPFSPEAEDAMIGAILLDGESIDMVIDTIEPKDLFDEADSIIYKAMVDLKRRGDGVNQITVAQELARQDKLDKMGGAAYLSHLISMCPTSLDIEHYADIVRRCSFYRQLLGVSSKMAKMAIEQDPNILTTMDACEAIIQELRQNTNPGSRRLILGQPRLIQTNPPRYIWNVNGKDLRMTLSEITVWGRFKNKVISELNFVPIKPKDWDNTINALITHSTPLEAPVDASEEQQLKITIRRWFERMREASLYSDLGVGRHVLREVNGISYYFFQSTPLLDYLKKEYKRGMNSEDLWTYCDKWNGIKHKIRVKTPTGSMPVDLWGVPIVFAETEEKETAPKWF